MFTRRSNARHFNCPTPFARHYICLALRLLDTTFPDTTIARHNIFPRPDNIFYIFLLYVILIYNILLIFHYFNIIIIIIIIIITQ
jgi:hypothetical protein